MFGESGYFSANITHELKGQVGKNVSVNITLSGPVLYGKIRVKDKEEDFTCQKNGYEDMWPYKISYFGIPSEDSKSCADDTQCMIGMSFFY